jgi:hypothetical protein
MKKRQNNNWSERIDDVVTSITKIVGSSAGLVKQ